MSTYFGRKLKRSRVKILLIFLTAVIIYNEYLSYVLQRWPHINCESSNCIKVLIVSDPQILGEQDSLSLSIPVEGIARWDSDRYLAKTFRLASNHLNPDVVIFLGDLMDEGSLATNEQFARYVTRFSNIFRYDDNVKAIFLPGDNDIGGENDEPILPDVVDRYHDSFGQSDIIKLNNFDFFKVNKLTHGIPKPLDIYFNTTRIILSHLPLLFLPADFVKQAVEQLRPQLIFSGHHHKSIRITADVTTGDEKLVKAMLPNEGPIWKFRLNDILVHEVMVPTCNYRMGTSDVGYGAAVIDVTNGLMWYSVLWLPQRFVQLFVYVGVLLTASLFACLWLLWSLCCLVVRRR